MNEMTQVKPGIALKRFSAGEISRIELGRQLGKPVSFGDVLLMLHAAELPLPRYGRPFNPEGIEFVRQLAERVKNG